MRFGVFYELQLPRPWNKGDERNLFHQALERAKMTIHDLDWIEINEAFATVVLSWARELQPRIPLGLRSECGQYKQRASSFQSILKVSINMAQACQY